MEETKGNLMLHKIEHVYTQEADSLSNLPQQITITQEDGGAGLYYSISTERWSFDKIEELIALIESCKPKEQNHDT